MRFAVAYVNGQYLPREEASLSIEDRAALFSDGVYEVVLIEGGRLIDYAAHIERLKRSLAGIHMAMPFSEKALATIIRELIRRNGASKADAALYLQVSRGVGKRNHLFPANARPGVVMTISKLPRPKETERTEGVKVITHPDLRWLRRDIKSISLLPNVLARQKAAESGAREAWLIDARGVVTEASAANAYIVDAKGTIITHPADTNILSGITRDAVLKLARKARIKVLEKPFTLKQALAAKEAFITSTTAGVLPVAAIDKTRIGAPGAVTKKLMALYRDYCENQGA